MGRHSGRPSRGRLVQAIGAAAIMTGVAGAALAVATAAQASWTPVTTLTPQQWEGVGPAIAASAKGALVTAWQAIDNANPNCPSQIQMRVRSTAGKWGSVRQLTPCTGPGMVFPAVASNAAGFGVVAWLRTTDNAIQAVTVSPTGTVGPVRTITPANNQAYFPMVAVSPAGQAVVVWQTITATSTGPNGILARFITPGSVLGKVRSLGASTQLVSAPVFSKTGIATVAYTATKVYAVRFTPTGVGKSAVILSPGNGTSYGKPQVADNSNGDTFVFAPLNVTTKTTQSEHLVLRKWSKSRVLGKVITVGTAASTVTVQNVADGPALAVDGPGDAVVVWNSALSSTKAAVFGRRVSPAGSLGPAVRLGTGYLSHIGIDPAGTGGLITWQSTPYQSGLVTTIYGRHVTATKGTFGGLITFTADGAYAQLAVDNAGASGVVWERSSLGSIIQSRFGS